MNFEVAELLKLWTEKTIEIDPTESVTQEYASGDQQAAL